MIQDNGINGEARLYIWNNESNRPGSGYRAVIVNGELPENRSGTLYSTPRALANLVATYLLERGGTLGNIHVKDPLQNPDEVLVKIEDCGEVKKKLGDLSRLEGILKGSKQSLVTSDVHH